MLMLSGKVRIYERIRVFTILEIRRRSIRDGNEGYTDPIGRAGIIFIRNADDEQWIGDCRGKPDEGDS